MKMIVLLLFISLSCSAQTDLVNILKGGEILVNGLSFFKASKSGGKAIEFKMIESVCVKNKLSHKITFTLTGKDEEGEDIRKELVIPDEGKECMFELPKGIYNYEIVLPDKEVFKKGEYRFTETVTIVVK